MNSSSILGWPLSLRQACLSVDFLGTTWEISSGIFNLYWGTLRFVSVKLTLIYSIVTCNSISRWDISIGFHAVKLSPSRRSPGWGSLGIHGKSLERGSTVRLSLITIVSKWHNSPNSNKLWHDYMTPVLEYLNPSTRMAELRWFVTMTRHRACQCPVENMGEFSTPKPN